VVPDVQNREDYPTQEGHLYVTDILWDLRFARQYIFIFRYSETQRRGALEGTSYFSSSGWKIQLAVSPKLVGLSIYQKTWRLIPDSPKNFASVFPDYIISLDREESV